MAEKDTNKEHFKEVNVYELNNAMEGFKLGVSVWADTKTKNIVDTLVDMVQQYLK